MPSTNRNQKPPLTYAQVLRNPPQPPPPPPAESQPPPSTRKDATPAQVKPVETPPNPEARSSRHSVKVAIPLRLINKPKRIPSSAALSKDAMSARIANPPTETQSVSKEAMSVQGDLPNDAKDSHSEMLDKARHDSELSQGEAEQMPKLEELSLRGDEVESRHVNVDRSPVAKDQVDSDGGRATAAHEERKDSKQLEEEEEEEEEEEVSDNPRLSTYISLQNEMMRLAHTHSPNPSTQASIFQRAAHIASILLRSHDKHADLPLMIRAHACLVLACEDKSEAFRRCDEAYEVIGKAVEEGVLGVREGEEMRRVCGELLGRAREEGYGDRVDDDEGYGGGEGEGDNELP